MRRALAICENSFGPDHPNVATALNNLAALLQDTNRFAEAEPLLCAARWPSDKKSSGPNASRMWPGPSTIWRELLQDTNRLSEAEPLMRRALAIDEKSFGPDHPDVARPQQSGAAASGHEPAFRGRALDAPRARHR